MPSPPPYNSTAPPTQSSAMLIRRSLFKFVFLLVAIFVLTSYLLVYIAKDLDRIEAQESEFHTETAVKSLEKSLVTILSDYGIWGEAYTHLHLQVDSDWAFVRENIGPTLYTDFAIDGLFVIDDLDRTVYTVIKGEMAPVEASQWLAQPALPFVERARSVADAETPISEFITINGVPALLAAIAIGPGSDPMVLPDKRRPSVLIFVTLLDNAMLEQLGTTYGVENLHIATAAEVSTGSTLALGKSGAVGSLYWTPEKPSTRLLELALPLVIFAALIVCLMTWVILRRTTIAAKAFDAGYAALKSSEAALATSEERFRDVVEASSDWVWEVDGDGRFTYLSERFETVTGLAKVSWIGKVIDDLLHTEVETISHWLSTPNRKSCLALQCHYFDDQGRERITRLSARAIASGGLRGTATDVTEEVESRRRIEFLSQHDPLTGLANRTRLQAFLEQKLSSLSAADNPLVVISLDLDRFKPVNDLLGHAVGDLVLDLVAKRLSGCVRNGDLVARVGGDEFILVLDAMGSQEEIEDLCARMIETIEQPINVEEQEVFVGASFGIALAPNDGREVAELLRYSDIALYEAKAAGRSTWRFYAGDMNEKIIERRRMESDLRFAIKHGELRLHFQPRYRISDGEMVGAEALVRWQHPVRGLIPPDMFIPIAEDSGLIVPLGDWVLETACNHAATWPEGLFVSVNLSPIEFKRSNVVERIQNNLVKTGIDPTRLELEITESTMLEDAAGTLETMKALKALGIRITMDDFGTGYSSLNNLRTFPFDGLKIDRSFLNRLANSEEDKSVIEAMIGLGRALSLTVTAEGIETAEHLQWIRTVSCDEGQGYFLSRPLDTQMFSALLAETDSPPIA